MFIFSLNWSYQYINHAWIHLTFVIFIGKWSIFLHLHFITYSFFLRRFIRYLQIVFYTSRKSFRRSITYDFLMIYAALLYFLFVSFFFVSCQSSRFAWHFMRFTVYCVRNCACATYAWKWSCVCGCVGVCLSLSVHPYIIVMSSTTQWQGTNGLAFATSASITRDNKKKNLEPTNHFIVPPEF